MFLKHAAVVVVVVACLCMPALAGPALQNVRIGEAVTSSKAAPGFIRRAWAFCPTTRGGCVDPLWVELEVSVDVYSERLNDPHQSGRKIIDTSARDAAPLVKALQAHFVDARIASDAERVGTVQGLVQAIGYAFDTDTGWTEYPKFLVELIGDEQGDCDDAAIATAVLLEGLGYPPWFVQWRPLDPRLPSGHISTAIARDRGDLKTAPLPASSRWIEGPGGAQLLHVDGTGTIGGCPRGCTALGWNEWHKGTPPLRAASLIRANDPALDDKLGIAAWSNGGLERPDRKLADRRGASRAAIELKLEEHDDHEETNKRRLVRLGHSEEDAEKLLKSEGGANDDDVLWIVLSILVAAGIVAVVVFGIVGSMGRKRAGLKLSEQRARARF
ncbi:MAG: hypothetical protein Q8O67_10590 [Deltaproteobacteria bacterium]|nr:hypothetical protein [Deltaproteobacteria bacterium]